MKTIKNLLFFLAMLYCIVCLMQTFFFTENFIGLVDNILFPFGAVFAVMYYWRNLRYDLFSMVVLGFVSLVAIAAFFAIEPFTIQGVLYLISFSKMLIFIPVIQRLVSSSETKIRLYQTILVGFVLLVFINLFLVINPYGGGELLQNIYSPTKAVNYLYFHEGGAFRLNGTQVNPNNNGLIFIMFAIFFFLGERRMWRYGLIAMGIVFLTQSRTLVIISVAITGLFLLYRMKRINWMKAIQYILLAVVLMLLLLYFGSTNLKSLINGDAFASHSFVNRIDNVKVLFDSNFRSIVFGHGYCENQMLLFGAYIDSEIISIIYQYGILGGLGWLGMILFLFYLSRKHKEYQVFFAAFGVLVFLSGFTNLLFMNRELNILLISFLAIIYFGQPDLVITKPTNKPSKV